MSSSLINIASTGPISTTAMEAQNATAQLFPVMSSNQPITTGDTAPARAMPVKVHALEVSECSWDTSVPMTQSGESASSEQKNEKLRPQAQMIKSWVDISGIKPMIEARKPKMIKSRRERRRLPVTLKR